MYFLYDSFSTAPWVDAHSTTVMEVPKLIIFLCCTYYSFASDHSHTIPVEGYETELQDLGQHVDHHETPVRVIKITKTIAVKIPVPYPVKVIEKVPYPVHINKPYPVPVPHIVKAPPSSHKHAHEAQGIHHGDGYHSQAYQVQEAPSHDSDDSGPYGPVHKNSFSSGGPSQIEPFAEEYQSYEGPPGSSYDSPSHIYEGSSGIPNGESFETKSYDAAIQEFIHKQKPNGGYGHNSFH